MDFLIEKKMDCSKIKPSECSDMIVEKLITGAGIKLRADKVTDKVNGHLRIDHHKGLLKKHKIYITIYDKNEKPNDRHQTTFEKPKEMPTLNDLKKLLD